MNEKVCPIIDLEVVNYFYNPDYEKDENIINA
jgi:hypothetical protein